jgi:hypothetical protein
MPTSSSFSVSVAVRDMAVMPLASERQQEMRKGKKRELEEEKEEEGGKGGRRRKKRKKKWGFTGEGMGRHQETFSSLSAQQRQCEGAAAARSRAQPWREDCSKGKMVGGRWLRREAGAEG